MGEAIRQRLRRLCVGSLTDSGGLSLTITQWSVILMESVYFELENIVGPRRKVLANTLLEGENKFKTNEAYSRRAMQKKLKGNEKKAVKAIFTMIQSNGEWSAEWYAVILPFKQQKEAVFNDLLNWYVSVNPFNSDDEDDLDTD